MFRNGIYRIDYRSMSHPGGPFEDALVLLRDGQIIGADRHGGLYASAPGTAGGKDAIPRSVARAAVTLRLTAPPHGELVTGQTIAPAGATFELSADLDALSDHQSAIVDVAGQPVEITVRYLGPLPD